MSMSLTRATNSREASKYEWATMLAVKANRLCSMWNSWSGTTARDPRRLSVNKVFVVKRSRGSSDLRSMGHGHSD